MYPVGSSQAVNTPSVKAGDGSTAIQILAPNTARRSFSIQNVGTTAAKVCFGTATTDVFHFVLKGGSADNDGLGGSITFNSGYIYNGNITFFGASTAKVVAFEQAP